MKKIILILVLFPVFGWSQKETKAEAPIRKVTVFKEGAQVEHAKELSLGTGKQFVVFQKLTDFLDPSSIQLKCSESATILSVRTRKNFDDKTIAETELTEKNDRKKALEKQERTLRDEYKVLLLDEQLLMKNNSLSSQQQAMKIAELKEASTFFHAKLSEINTRKSQLDSEIEAVVRKINTIEQEINTRKGLPVVNYTEVEVELDVEKAGTIEFDFTYITHKASWKPYYDMRSNGVGAPVLLEAKGLVTQNTGIDWKNVKLILSTNDPYDNTQEPKIDPWYVNYYTPAPRKQVVERYIPEYNFDGETIHGEVTDATTGEPLAFAKISMNNNPLNSFTTDATGHFTFSVPRGERSYIISYLGYHSQYVNINAPYIKTQLYPEAVAMETLNNPIGGNAFGRFDNGQNKDLNLDDDYSGKLDEVSISAYKIDGATRTAKLSKRDLERIPGTSRGAVTQGVYSTTIANQVEKDLRMEFQIETPFSVPSDDADHRVAIATYQMKADYEYHAVPKLDESVYLVAQISGWEKLNLLNGESNLYFDGTYIGKSYIDVNSSKDTLSFSLGKDKKIVASRKRSEEMSKTRLLGNRYKYEVTWDFTIRNNGGASIPIIVKDHFPISVNDDIKVKRGTFVDADLDEKTGILTWKFTTNKGETKQFKFDYQVDYGKSQPVYLE
ncbi:mucoidy inhibitor MuiA family protein [Fluviicola chungangensis]|uniref:Mucoidy inhibitor MuiA family protein n=1 Tax=Fluviicola chungangensis TaxID=2597671 RepID=A0A556N0W6_9FLAO|nr:mucoidy inhibitor MuiA family protein [Fluviicola chungangensis]TSJ45830.1 mucoidy inhibitor MuiA family protein [Fluviicola chungangensis]